MPWYIPWPRQLCRSNYRDTMRILRYIWMLCLDITAKDSAGKLSPCPSSRSLHRLLKDRLFLSRCAAAEGRSLPGSLKITSSSPIFSATVLNLRICTIKAELEEKLKFFLSTLKTNVLLDFWMFHHIMNSLNGLMIKCCDFCSWEKYYFKRTILSINQPSHSKECYMPILLFPPMHYSRHNEACWASPDALQLVAWWRPCT